MHDGRELLAAWIHRTKMQKQEAAALIGITKPEMSKLLSGVRRPTLPLAVRIEAVTGISVVAWVPSQRAKLAERTYKSRQSRNVSRQETAHARS